MDERIEDAVKELLNAVGATLDGEEVTGIVADARDAEEFVATVRANDGEVVKFRVTITLDDDEDEA